jgi:hypothetical protein
MYIKYEVAILHGEERGDLHRYPSVMNTLEGGAL